MDKQRILIVDDNPGTCETLATVLKAKGYDPVSVGNGKKATESVSESFFNLALIDLVLPDMQGIEVLEKIKTFSPATEAVIITGHASVDTAVQAMHDGAFSYVIKPVDMDHLLAIIDKAVEKQKLQAERNAATEALRESEERYRQFFEDDLSGAYSCKPDGRMIACNPAFVRMFGFSSVEEAMNTNFELLYPSMPTTVPDRVRDEKRLENLELKMSRIDGTFIHVIANIVGVFDDQGDLEEIKGYLMDITNRKNLEMQLRQSRKMEAIGTLAGGIAHDFNNILFPLIGYTEMTMEEVPEEGMIRRNMDEILKAAHRAKDLVQQILIISREREAEKLPIQIHFVIKEVLNLLRSSLPTTINIRHNIGKAHGHVLADPSQIHQVMMNLCTNAYHAMREKGGMLEISLNETEISAEELAFKQDMTPGLYLKLTVRDSGHGMSPEVVERVFDPYFTTKDTGEGSGIGLSIVHGIVRNHGGYITVYSEPDKGSAFCIYFPLIDADTGSLKTAPDDAPLLTGRERILLVDDEKRIVEMEKQMLEQLGYDVTAFTGSLKTLEVFAGDPEGFDLIITDMTMPNMTGLELSENILRIRPDMPIILCTGYSEMVTKEKAEAMGIREFVMKPALRREMAETIRRALGD
ncbi:response regulator [Desulfobacterales bacterium HSG2]|nr:response regulator [Desulfobacterales bacterium HSG2]